MNTSTLNALMALRQQNPTWGRRRLAKALGLSPNTVRGYMHRSNPTVETSSFSSGSEPHSINVQFKSPTEEHRLEKENRELRQHLRKLVEDRVVNEDYEKFVADVVNQPVHIPDWTRNKTGGKYQVIPTAPFSDWHFDEVVKPEQVQFRNGYNREIAEKRLKNYADKVCMVAFDFLKGFEYPGIIVPMLGDNFSGSIHEELSRTNEDTNSGSMLYWVSPVVAMIRQFANEFGHVWVPVVVGNHGRNTQKPIYKNRARDNADWLLAQLVKREFIGDNRVSFAICESPNYAYSVYNTRFIMSHGDEAKGGTGIAGMLSPLLIQHARKRKIQDFDVWVVGHWHHRSAFRGIRSNGTGKGWDELASFKTFEYQEPQQDFFLTAPEHGVVAEMPIFCACDDEDWKKGTGSNATGPVVMN